MKMLKLLEKKLLYREFIDGLCYKGYIILNNDNLSKDIRNNLSRKRWNDSGFHGYFELEVPYDKKNAEFMGVKYSPNDIQLLDDYLCYPYDQVVDGFFKYTVVLSPLVKNMSYQDAEDNNIYAKSYLQMYIISQDNEILECYMNRLVKKSSLEEGYEEYYLFVMGEDNGLIFMKELLKKYDICVYGCHNKDIIEKVDKTIDSIKGDNSYENYIKRGNGDYCTLRINVDENCYLELYVEFTKIGVRINNIRYVNNDLKNKNFTMNKTIQCNKIQESADEILNLIN